MRDAITIIVGIGLVVFILDSLGLFADTLYMICDRRYRKGAVTVVTLNVANDDEADLRIGAATWDRLCHGALKILCMWETHRKPAMELMP